MRFSERMYRRFLVNVPCVHLYNYTKLGRLLSYVADPPRGFASCFAST